jgi:hypothetical protein
MKKSYSPPSNHDEIFGNMIYSLEFNLVNEEKIKGRLLDSSNDILADFSDDKSTKNNDILLEPCFYNTHTINVLNQNWYSGNAILLGEYEKNSFTGSFLLEIAKNKSRSILILEVIFNEGINFIGNSKFKGNLEILLSNGEKISCIDRNLNGKQVNEDNSISIFSVYYITVNEYDKLSKTNISSVLCKFGDLQNGYENFVFDGVSKSFRCVIEGINDYSK